MLSPSNFGDSWLGWCGRDAGENQFLDAGCISNAENGTDIDRLFHTLQNDRDVVLNRMSSAELAMKALEGGTIQWSHRITKVQVTGWKVCRL